MKDMSLTPWDRAQPYLPWNLRPNIRNLRVEPVWFSDSAAFWYRRETERGLDYVIVDAESGTARPAFEREHMLAALAAVDTDPGAALDRIELLDMAGRLALDGRIYRFDGACLLLEQERRAAPDELLSPDGRRALYCKAGDLWLRDLDSGAHTRLTFTAEPHFEWAKTPDQNLENIGLRRRGIALPPVALWSPESRHIFTYQLDERQVRSLPLVQNLPDDGRMRPVLHDLRVAFTGDAHLPMAHQAVINADTGMVVPLMGGPVHVTETSGIEKREVWWSGDGSKLWYLDHDRYETCIALIEMQAETGAIREIIREESSSFVDMNMEFGRAPNVAILDRTSEAVWFSQGDGWAHLYLVNLTSGEVIRQLTRGEWVVRDLLRVDTDRREAIFLAGGHGDCDTPYQRRVCAVSLDDGELRVLTPRRGDHDVAMRGVGWADMTARARRVAPLPDAISPDGRYLVSTCAPIDSAPVSELRRIDGTLVSELETAVIGRDDVILPCPFQALAADGQTSIHGMLWLPEGAEDATPGSVPVLELIYPGPQCIEQPLSAWPADASEFFKVAFAGALARIGIAVVIIDARGTPFRSKAFHDLCHGKLHDPGHLEDHAAALAQLFETYPGLDAKRVGIMGHSAGGHAAARAVLAHGDVWQVAIATAGSHDPRLYNHCWPEKWNGPLNRGTEGAEDSFAAADNARLAEQLRGALMLGHGDLDDNVHPAQTQRLIQALIAADRDFEQLMTPNDDHYTFPRSPYVVRREIDFLCRHLKPGKDHQ